MRGLADLARRKDAEEDFAARAILDQLQTKTVGAPPSSTGLTGDQLPETIFDLADFETVKNQVTLQLSNLELLNVLNTIGQITNTQSQSGPIPNTFKIEVATTSTSGDIISAFTPNPGEVWQLVGAIGTSGSGTSGTIFLEVKLFDIKNSRRAEIMSTSTTTGTDIPMTETTQNPIFLDENTRLEVEASGTFTTMEFKIPLIRVR